MDFGAIKAIELSAEENATLCDELAAINEVLSIYAEGVYGEPSVKRLVVDFKKGRHIMRTRIDLQAKMLRLIELEPVVIAAFIREMAVLVNSFYMTHRTAAPQLDEGDYFQEACFAMSTAVYSYDRSTRLSTYLYHAVKNKLTSFVRYEYGRFVPATDCDELSMALTIKDREPSNSDGEMVRLAIADAGLTEMEMVLIEACMRGDSYTSEEFIASLGINPNTGSLWTRQRLNQIYAKAKEKFKEAYLNRRIRVAA